MTFFVSSEAMQFCRLHEIVLDGIARTNHLGRFQSFHRLENLALDIDGQTRRHPIYIDFVSVDAFGLQDDLMMILVCKLDDFVFQMKDNTAVQSLESGRCTAANGPCSAG